MTARRFLADGCHVVLTTALWLAATLLGCLGLLPIAAILASGTDGQALAAQLANLSQHYLDAAPQARSEFNQNVGLLAGAVFGLALLMRAPFFIARLRADLQGGDTQ